MLNSYRFMSSICFVTCLLMLSFMAGCLVPGGERDRSVLIMGLENRPTSLDPRYSTDAVSSKLCELLYSRLVRSDGLGNFEADLALSWDIEESRIYRFKLRQGVTFTDGTPLTSASVRATILSIVRDGSSSPKRADFQFIEEIETPDPETIVIRLSRPFSPFLKSMTVGIVPDWAFDDNGEKLRDSPVGSGPYRLVSSIRGREYCLQRNQSYYGISPCEERISFRVIKDGMMRAIELMKGTIDITQNDIPPRMVSMLAGNADLKMRFLPSNNTSYLGFNLRHDLLRKVEVRRAIAQAINRDAIIHRIFHDLAIPAESLFPTGHWAFTDDVVRYPYDPTAARRRLDEAGLPDPDGSGPLPRCRFVYKTSQNPFRLMIAQVIQRDLAAVGIEISIQSLEWPTFYEDIKKGNFELFSLMWVGVEEPDLLHHLCHRDSVPPNGANRGYFMNERVDELLDKARFELDRERRALYYHQVQRILALELPWINLWHEYNVVVMANRVQGFRLFRDANFQGLLTTCLEENSR